MGCLHKLQERITALTEDKPVPALYSSTDVRPLKMEDFRFAHEQVGLLSPIIAGCGRLARTLASRSHLTCFL